MNNETNSVFSNFEVDEQDEANVAHQNLIASFEGNSKGLLYPKEFCGEYIKDNVLHICLNTMDDNVIDEYKKITNYSDKVVFEKTTYSLSYLFELQDNLWDYLMINMDGLISIYVNQYENRLVIEVKEKEMDVTYGLVDKYIENNSKYDSSISDIIDIKIGSEIVNTSASPVYGGTKLYYSGGSVRRTLCVSGSLGSGYGFVTCGHHTTIYEQMYNALGASYGTTIYVRFNNNGYGDFSLVQLNSNYCNSRKMFTGTGGVVDMNGYVDFPVAGSTLSRYGAVSGVSTVTVSATNQTVNMDGTTIKGLCRGNSSVGSIGGDSGGPYRRGQYIYGVHSGNKTTDNTIVYFTPYYYIRNCGYNFTF